MKAATTKIGVSIGIAAARRRAFLLTLAQRAFEIPSAISNGDNLYARLEDTKSDRRPALKTDGAQTRQEIVTASATLREMRQFGTGRVVRSR